MRRGSRRRSISNQIPGQGEDPSPFSSRIAVRSGRLGWHLAGTAYTNFFDATTRTVLGRSPAIRTSRVSPACREASISTGTSSMRMASNMTAKTRARAKPSTCRRAARAARAAKARATATLRRPNPSSERKKPRGGPQSANRAAGMRTQRQSVNAGFRKVVSRERFSDVNAVMKQLYPQVKELYSKRSDGRHQSGWIRVRNQLLCDRGDRGKVKGHVRERLSRTSCQARSRLSPAAGWALIERRCVKNRVD